MTTVLTQALLAALGTLGFCVIFRVPIKCMPISSAVGGIAWGTYQLIIYAGYNDPVVASFVAAAMVGLCSDICARVFKEAATIFTIPGILPLVPGAYIFNTMRALLDNDFASTGSYATDTLKLAAAIALGLLVVGSITKIIRSIYNKATGIVKQFYRF